MCEAEINGLISWKINVYPQKYDKYQKKWSKCEIAQWSVVGNMFQVSGVISVTISTPKLKAGIKKANKT